MGVLEFLTHNDLDSALKNKQLQVAFQPTISLSQLSALGAEAFLRWQHPALGLLPANLFMPFAREQGRTREVALFMLRETLRAVAQWRQSGLGWNAYVNIDGADLSDGMLADSIALLLCEFEVPAETLTLDIRESDLNERGAQILPHLAGLRAMGVGIALDTTPGEAPLQDISHLPLTEMKVAGPAIIRFIELTQDTGLGRIVNRLQQARAAGLRTTAVRVESEATLWALQRVGFDAAQGAYISPPVPLNELVRWDKIWRQAAQALSAQKQQMSTPEPAPAQDEVAEELLQDHVEETSAPFTPEAELPDQFDADFLSRALDVVAPLEVEAEPQSFAAPAPIFSNVPAAQAQTPDAEEIEEFSFDPPAAQAIEAAPAQDEKVAFEPFPEFTDEEDAALEEEDATDLSAPIGEFSFDNDLANEDVDDALDVDSRFIDDGADAQNLAPENAAAPSDHEPDMVQEAPPPPAPRYTPPVAREESIKRDFQTASSAPPPNFTIHRKSANTAGAKASDAKSSALLGVVNRTKAKTAASKPAPVEHVLIERRLPGLDKPITMQVPSSAREGKSLFGKMKPVVKK